MGLGGTRGTMGDLWDQGVPMCAQGAHPPIYSPFLPSPALACPLRPHFFSFFFALFSPSPSHPRSPPSAVVLSRFAALWLLPARRGLRRLSMARRFRCDWLPNSSFFCFLFFLLLLLFVTTLGRRGALWVESTRTPDQLHDLWL